MAEPRSAPAVGLLDARNIEERKMAFELPPLPYAHNALAPVIDEQTMRLHHGKHHQAYVDNLNKAVDADPALQGGDLAALLATASNLPKVVRNNGGGHWNHSFFWETMHSGGSEPQGALRDAITSKWGSLDAFKEAFNAAGAGQFGSGWVWLVASSGGTLEITATPNQDNPLMDVSEIRGTPILGNDVWEHAYYLTYQNRRPEYLKAWWQVVNWDKAAERLAAAGGKQAQSA